MARGQPVIEAEWRRHTERLLEMLLEDSSAHAERISAMGAELTQCQRSSHELDRIVRDGNGREPHTVLIARLDQRLVALERSLEGSDGEALSARVERVRARRSLRVAWIAAGASVLAALVGLLA